MCAKAQADYTNLEQVLQWYLSVSYPKRKWRKGRCSKRRYRILPRRICCLRRCMYCLNNSRLISDLQVSYCVLFWAFLKSHLCWFWQLFFQLLLSIAGSFQSLINSIKSSENKFRSFLNFWLLMLTFVSVYHWWHSFYRLIAVPSFQRKKQKTNNQGPSWVSPTRMWF